MGDRAARGAPEPRAGAKAARRGAGPAGGDDDDFKRARRGAAPALGEGGGYAPRSRAARDAYEGLLAAVVAQFGDQPADVLHGAAEEVLAVLKNEEMQVGEEGRGGVARRAARATRVGRPPSPRSPPRQDPAKQKEVEDLLGPLPADRFAAVVALGKAITDWAPPAADGGVAAAADAPDLDDDIGVAVEFEGDDSDDDAGVLADAVVESDGEEDEGGDGGATASVRAGAAGVAAAAAAAADDGGVHPQDVDAHWLQREVAKAYGGGLDAGAAKEKADAVLAALAAPTPDRDAENALVSLLDFDKFALVKALLRDRARIVWAVRLARAATPADRAAAEAAAAADPAGAAVLAALRATRVSAKDRAAAAEARIRAEAAALRGAGADAVAAAAAAGALSAPPPPPDRHTLDLDSLAFPDGARTMTNKRCDLPPGSFRAQHKGYEEVHVPALAPPAMDDGEALKKIDDLPEWARPAFKGMATLNRVQSRVCDAALFGTSNLLLCAPTGAGKTNVAMLTILQQVGLHRRPDGSVDGSAFKCVYIAPMKALVAEQTANLAKRLAPYGLTVRELTGDSNLTRAELDAASVVVATPEKWDIVTRRAGGDRAAAASVRLLIIDEIHLLHDTRGPVLEAIVARTLRQTEATQELVRVVGLSATLPNYEDVASFLRVDPAKGLFFFDNRFRPVPLAQQYVGVTVRKPLQRHQLINDICYAKVAAGAGKHQTLVFVHSRKDTVKTARHLRDAAAADGALARFVRDGSASAEVLTTEAEACKDAALRDLLPSGFAVHHAGMARADRALVEDLFADGHVAVLVSTATLAWGVNLPAHTVVIKGTQVYNPEMGAWGELSPLDVGQMLGRAGRPQFDSEGEGVIITGHAELQFYLSLFNTQLPVESQLAGKLADALNAEVVLGTVQSLQDAAHWLGYTYLYVRMLCSPGLYGVPVGAADADPRLLARRLDLAHSAFAELDRAGLVRYDRASGNVHATDLGRVASHYYVGHHSIAAYARAMRPTMGDIELLRLFALSDEFKHVVVRDEEKLELAKLLDRVPVPVKEPADDPAAKVNALLQAHISRLPLDGYALAADMQYVRDSAGRLVRCLFELALRRGWARVAGCALRLSTCVTRRMWAAQTPLRQFKGVLPDLLARVERRDVPWERYADLTAGELGELVRAPKAGKTLHRLVHSFPKLDVAAHVQPITRSVLKVDLTLTPDFQWDDAAHGAALGWWLWVEDADGDALLHSQYWILPKARAGVEANLSFTVPVGEPVPPQYFIRVISDAWLGAETLLPVSFRHLILPAKFPPPTELLDLAPLPTSALRDARFAALFPFATFNPIQTQTFAALFGGDDAALVCAPAGSGKTVCAELAILRGVVAAATDGGRPLRAVYVTPHPALAASRAADWKKRFAPLGLAVGELTGDAAADAKTLARSSITVSTPAAFDALSRRWKQRKAVQGITLFIADELHMVGGAGGPTLEVCVSRVRQMAASLPHPVRVVGLSACLANAKDVGEWLGAPAGSVFAFAPTARPAPLDVRVAAFDVANLDARTAAMARPTYAALLAHAAGGAPGLVFAPTARHARLAALDLLTRAAADGAPARFLVADPADVEPLVAGLEDAPLAHALAHGVGWITDVQPPAARALVERLFSTGAISVVVATASVAWGLPLAARVVVVAGTQAYEGGGAAGADYPVTDVLQMLGCARLPGGPSEPGGGRCAAVLMCHSAKKAYYSKFVFDPLPAESHLDQELADHLAAEVVVRTVATKQDAVDWLTWTLLYRRLPANPNYYGLSGVSHRHLSDHLSELVEATLAELEAARAVAVDNDFDVEPLNLGMIATYYYVGVATIELVAASLTAKTKLRGLLEIVAASPEFASLPARPGDGDAVRRLAARAPLPAPSSDYDDPHAKAHALLQAHFSRAALPATLAADARVVLPAAARLLRATVDVAASSGWLAPALAAMEASQMVAQGVWAKDSPLLQLPGVTAEAAAAAAAAGAESVYDVADLEPAARASLLGLDARAAAAVDAALARYPDISLAYAFEAGEGQGDAAAPRVKEGDTVALTVDLEREGGADPGPALAPRFPGVKEEGWWLVVGAPGGGSLLAVKRVTVGASSRARLEFPAPPPSAGPPVLYFMCDAYAGCDQEYELAELTVDAVEAMEGEEGGGGGGGEAAMDEG